MRPVHSSSCVIPGRGVFQSLVEKHFPAPDRQKLFSLLGIDLPSKKPPPANNNAQDQKGTKRKGLCHGLVLVSLESFLGTLPSNPCEDGLNVGD